MAWKDGFHKTVQGTDKFTWISSPTNEYVAESLKESPSVRSRKRKRMQKDEQKPTDFWDTINYTNIDKIEA